ncbi:MAG: Uma2 family endonuclease, partial [Calditrichaeota bacterium]
MAEAKDAAVIEQPPPEPTTSPPQADVPIEQRNDVTVDELEQLSLPYPAELYNGKVVYKMANYLHGKLQARLTVSLGHYLEKRPIGDVVTETNFLWPDRPRESRVPDIAFIRKERMPRDLNHFPEMAPDLAIEIISPEDNFIQMMCKVEEYLQQG